MIELQWRMNIDAYQTFQSNYKCNYGILYQKTRNHSSKLTIFTLFSLQILEALRTTMGGSAACTPCLLSKWQPVKSAYSYKCFEHDKACVIFLIYCIHIKLFYIVVWQWQYSFSWCTSTDLEILGVEVLHNSFFFT